MEKNVYEEGRLAFHKDKILALADERVISPIYVRVKPTNVCNHRCYYCSYLSDNNSVRDDIDFKDEIPREKILEILDDFAEMGVRAVTYSGGGEPLIYPHIIDALQKTINYGIDLSMITNGQKLNGKPAELLAGAKWIRVSADSPDEKTFFETRRVPEQCFFELKENLKRFSEIKNPDCILGINFVVNKKNYLKVYDAVKFFRDVGADNIKITPVYTSDFFDYHKDIKTNVVEQIKKAREEFSDENFMVFDTYDKDFKFSGGNERPLTKCYVMQINPIIGADCRVYFCHDKAYTTHGVLGSIKDKSFKELWFSQESEEIFKRFNPKTGCLHHCTYDSKNILCDEMLKCMNNTERFKPKNEVHKNFV